MGKKVNALTKANIKEYGIELAPQYDFTDDGNHFRGFIYKGMPMTQCYAKSDGEVYLSIREDYLENNFTWSEWAATEESNLCDDFNGVSEIDLDKLVENLERIIAKRDELNRNIEIPEEDILRLQNQVWECTSYLEGFINTVKSNLKWWELNDWKLTRAANYVKSLEREVKKGWEIAKNTQALSIRELKQYIETVKAGKEVIERNDLYVRELKELMGE